MLKDNILDYKPLTQCVMDYLKNQFDEGKLKPGEEININELIRVLSVSRTPIREALIQLKKEGFIEYAQNRKFRVKKITLKDIKNIFQIIGLLEAEAAEIACDKRTDDDIKELEKFCNQMRDALEKDNFHMYLEINDRSHKLMIKYCDNDILKDCLIKLKERLYDFPKIVLNISEWENLLMDHHYKMIQYLKKRDKIALRKLIKNEHWSFSKNYPYLLQYYDLIDNNINIKNID